MTDHHCENICRFVDHHFALSISSKDEKRMREHLVICDGCHAYYERHLLLARFDRQNSVEERLARGLGFGSPRHRYFAALSLWTPAVALPLVAVLLWFGYPKHATTQARSGSFADSASVQIYALEAHQAPSPASSIIKRSQELAFAYHNPEGYPYLMIAAVDAQRNVYWYYPAWHHRSQTPTSISIAKTSGWIELPDAVLQPLSLGPIKFYALFSQSPRRVVDVENQLRQQKARPRIANNEKWIELDLRVLE